MPRPALAAAALATLAGACPADEVLLANGARIVAEVAPADAGSRGVAALATPYGRLVIDRSEVVATKAESPAETEYRRRAPTVSDTVEAQFALASWCRDNGVAEGMRRHLRRVLELAPDHAEARMLLGYQQVDGRWMTRDDVLVARGLVRWRGSYRTPQEVALLEAAERREAAALAWRRELAGWRADLVGGDREASRVARERFEGLTDPDAVPELLELLDEESFPEARRVMVRALGGLATADALGALVRRAVVDIDPEVRAEAVERLAAADSPGAAAPLAAALRADDPRVVNTAAWALGELGATAAVEPLVDALVTTHRRRVGNDSGGDSYTMTFGQGAGTFGFGGGGPRIEDHESRNPAVLEALAKLTGVNFQFDKSRWREWLASRQNEPQADLRRDP